MTDSFPGSETTNPLLERGQQRMDARGEGPQTQAPPYDRAEFQEQQYSNRAQNLMGALDTLQDEGVLLLPAITSALGKEVTVKVRRLAIQQLLAADLVPRKAEQMAAYMIDMADKRARTIRQKWGLPDDAPITDDQWESDQFTEQEIIRGAMEYVGGSEADAKAAATGGIFSFVASVVCAAVMDPPIYYSEDLAAEGAKRGRPGAVVWRIPQADQWHIFNWALKTEADAVSRQVSPFPEAQHNAPSVARPKQPRDSSSDPGQV